MRSSGVEPALVDPGIGGLMYPSWIDPVMQLRLNRERAAELRNSWMAANGSGLGRARPVDSGRRDGDGKMLARFTRLVAALAARRRLASDDPCR